MELLAVLIKVTPAPKRVLEMELYKVRRALKYDPGVSVEEDVVIDSFSRFVHARTLHVVCDLQYA